MWNITAIAVLLCLACFTINSAYGVICNGAAAERETYNGRSIVTRNSEMCDSKPWGGPAYVPIYKFCPPLSNDTNIWTRGIQVMGNCAAIPKYTAVGTFPYNHGVGTGFSGPRWSGYAGILLNCYASGLSMYAQSCDRSAFTMYNINNAWNGGLRDNPLGYYVIEQPTS